MIYIYIYIYVRLSLPGKPKKFISGLHQTALTSNSTTQQLPELGPKSPKSCQFALMIIIIYIYIWVVSNITFIFHHIWKLWGWAGQQRIITGWWFGTFFNFSIYWECHHPNWRTPSFFQRRRYTTNQYIYTIIGWTIWIFVSICSVLVSRDWAGLVHGVEPGILPWDMGKSRHRSPEWSHFDTKSCYVMLMYSDEIRKINMFSVIFMKSNEVNFFLVKILMQIVGRPWWRGSSASKAPDSNGWVTAAWKLWSRLKGDMLSHQYGGFHQSGVPRKSSKSLDHFSFFQPVVTTGYPLHFLKHQWPLWRMGIIFIRWMLHGCDP